MYYMMLAHMWMHIGVSVISDPYLYYPQVQMCVSFSMNLEALRVGSNG